MKARVIKNGGHPHWNQCIGKIYEVRKLISLYEINEGDVHIAMYPDELKFIDDEVLLEL